MSRGILTNKVSHRKQCLVTVRRQAAPGTTIGELKAGTFALLSRREEYRLFCPGHPAKIGQLLTGLYVFHIQPGCRVSRTNWTMRGHFRRSSQFTWQLSIIKV